MIVNAARLAAALAALKPAYTSKTTLPILRSVLLTPDEGRRMLRLGLTNLETSLSVEIEADGMGFGPVALDYAELVRLVNHKDGIVSIVKGDDGIHIQQLNSNGRAIIPSQDAGDHPLLAMAHTHGDWLGQLDSAELKRLRLGVIPAAASDDSRPVLAGIHIHDVGRGLRFSAADGFRLASMTTSVIAEDVDYIVPAKALDAIARIADWLELSRPAEGNGAPLGIVYSLTKYRQTVYVRGYQRLIDGTFPDLMSIIPQSTPNYVSISTDAIEQGYRSVGKRDANGTPLIVTADPDGESGMRIKEPSLSWNGASVESIAGVPVEFGINLEYAHWAAQSMAHEDGRLLIGLSEPNNAFRVDGDHLTAVIMPMVIGHSYR